MKVVSGKEMARLETQSYKDQPTKNLDEKYMEKFKQEAAGSCE